MLFVKAQEKASIILYCCFKSQTSIIISSVRQQTFFSYSQQLAKTLQTNLNLTYDLYRPSKLIFDCRFGEYRKLVTLEDSIFENCQLQLYLRMGDYTHREKQAQYQKQVYSLINDGKSSQHWYLKITPIIIGNNSSIIIIKTIASAIALIISLHYGSFFHASDPTDDSGVFKISLASLMKKQVSQILVTITLTLEFYVLQSIILLHIKKMQQIPIASSINQFLDKYLIVIVQINILLAYLSFLHESILIVKIISFSFASFTAVFFDYFLMPKNNPYDFLYTIETSFIVLFRCSFLISISLNLMEYYKTLSLGSSIASFILIIILSYQFYCRGAFIYNNKTSSLCFYVSYSLFMSINITIFLKLFITIDSWTSVSLFLLSMLKIYITSINLSIYRSLDQQITSNSLKIMTGISMKIHEEFSEETRCLLIGIIQIHRNNCINEKCISGSLFAKQKINSVNIFAEQQMEKIFFYITKCLFQGLIGKSPNDVPILISYCEYLLYGNNMILPLLTTIERLEQFKLSILQQIRLQNIKDSIKKQLKKQNQSYQPKLIIEEVISLENSYFSIKETANRIIQKNIEIWQSFYCFISQEQILQKLKQIIDLKTTIKTNLINSSNYNRHIGLRAMISFFKLYLDNDLKKQRDISALSSNFTLNNGEQIHNHTSSPYQAIITAQDCFSPFSIVILAKFSLHKTLIIQKVSKSVTNLLSFEENELNEVELNTLLPIYLKQQHKRLMLSLIEEGFTSNKKSLKGAHSHCLKKDNTLVSACKSFKTYANIYGQVRFACIIKINPIQPIIIISNLKNVILQNSSNLQQLISQHTKEGFSKFYENIQQLINNKSHSNKELEQFSTYDTTKSKQIKFKATKIEYDTQNPILSIQIAAPQQPNNGQSFSSAQCLTQKIQTQFKQKKQFIPNIFMKEQKFAPVQNLPAIRRIKRIIWILGVIYLIFPMFFAFVSQYNCHNVVEYFERKVYFTNLLKQPYQLGIFYFQIEMNLLDGLQHIIHNVHTYQDKYISDFLNPIILKTVFDKSLFQDSYIQIENQSVNGQQLLSLDLKDVYFSIGSFISSYSKYEPQLTKQQFNKFNKLMVPFYDELQDIKNRLFLSYSQTFQFISIPDKAFISMMAGLFLFSVIFICINLYRLKATWSNLYKLLSNPSKEEYSKTIAYWQSLRAVLSPEQHKTNKMKFSKSSQVPQQIKERRFEDFNQTKRQVNNLFPIGILPIAVMLGAIFIIQYLKFIQIDEIRQFQQNGAVFLDGYPSCIVFSFCLLQRHYNQTVLNISAFQQESFEEVLQEFEQFKEIQYLARPQQESSQFYSLYKNYFFGNPCKNLPKQSQAQGFTYQKCYSYAEGHLNNGILAYERYTSELVQDVIEDSQIFQQQQLNTLIESLIFTNSLIEQMLRVWSIEFNDRVQHLIKNTILLNSIATVASIIIYYYFIIGKFMAKITVLQIRYKQAYSILMTKQRIQKDKIAQSELILCGFLQKK